MVQMRVPGAGSTNVMPGHRLSESLRRQMVWSSSACEAPVLTQFIGDPPFFLSNQKAFHPNNFVSSGSDEELFGGQPKDDSENDDLRGVIDDLTVENKRLKMLLKSTRSRSSPSHSEAQAPDRLFDVRVHGLSVEKKRELENLLRNFATSVHTTNANSMSSNAQVQPTSEGSSSSMPRQSRGKPLSLLPTDSGYGSNSNSHSNSAATNPGQTARIEGFPSEQPRKNRNTIQSYLHDIPDTLLPKQQSIYMSKRAKMALVVRRLESLFTGRVAAPGDHSQPLQQQDVSYSAARADDPTLRQGRAEGTREAHMLPQNAPNLDAYDRQNGSPPKKLKLIHELSAGSDAKSNTPSRPGSPAEQQRPTRPLDLDIHRAQVAEANVQYLRHLGMSSPQLKLQLDESSDSRWVYLNLLISMAQLHTINVTPTFIRQAIKKLSTKFELSPDGHKVRWCGGIEGTTFTQEEENAMHWVDPSPGESHEDNSGGNSSKRSKTDSSSNLIASEEPSSEDKTMQTSNASKQKPSTGTAPTSNMHTIKTKTSTPFDYKPLFAKKRYSPAISYLESSTSSFSNSPDSSGLANALSKSNLNRRNSDDGMITFYQTPYFCADLSADMAPTNWVSSKIALPWDTLGMPREYVSESPLRHHDACYFTPHFAPRPYVPSRNEAILTFLEEPIRSSGEKESLPADFTVSGIGGIIPEENFALDVTVLRKPARPNLKKNTYRVPFTGTLKRKRYEYEIDDCDKLDLQPSKLPPPSYVFFTSSNSSAQDDMMEDSDSDGTSSEALEINPPPLNFLHQFSTESEDDPDATSDEIDMLGPAREDPRIMEEERRFLINENVGRQVEGSLAATVGASRSSRQDDRQRALSMEIDDLSSSDDD